MATIGTFNEEGVNVDLYIPRKCHATNNLIKSFDHSAIQLSIANVDANGVADGTTTTFCITGYLRAQGESDHAINHLAIGKGLMRIKTGKKPRAKKGKAGKGAQQKGARPAPGKRSAPVAQKGAQQKAPQRGGAQQKAPQRGGAQQKAPQRGGAQQKAPQRGGARQQDQKQRQGTKPRDAKAAPQGGSKQAASAGRRGRRN